MNATEEYRRLYEEIGRNSEISQNLFVVNVTVTAALIGYGLNQQAGSIFLAPFAILVPSLFFLASQLESTTRIAAYLVVFLESDLEELQWETRLLALRERARLPTWRKYTLSLSGLYGLLAGVCLLLALRYWEFAVWSYLAVTVPLVVAVGAGVTTVVMAPSPRRMNSNLAAWRRVKAEAGATGDA